MSMRGHGVVGTIATTAGLLLGGVELVRLAARSRFRMGGPYWRWRLETAFGTDRRRWPPRRQRLLAALEYGRWVRRMRRGS